MVINYVSLTLSNATYYDHELLGMCALSMCI